MPDSPEQILLRKRCGLENLQAIEQLPEECSAQLVKIFRLWEGLHAELPKGIEQPCIVDLIINRGVYVPDYLLRVDLAKQTYARLEDDVVGHPGLIGWLEKQLSQLAYTMNSALQTQYKMLSKAST